MVALRPSTRSAHYAALLLAALILGTTLLGGCALLRPRSPASGDSPGDPPAGQGPGDPGGGTGGQPGGSSGGTSSEPGNQDDGTGDPAGGSTAWIDAGSSPFPVRGVIEGFYGQPWSQDERLSALDFMGRVGLNTYVYAPKDDTYQRDNWRELYPEDQLARFTALIAKAASGGINFVYSISPGLDITYSARAERLALAAKIDQLRAIGITTFMLSLDDVPDKLNKADSAAYDGDYALAQADLANWLYAEETAQSTGSFALWMTPTHYAGTKADDYLTTLGTKLDQAVQLAWTGPKVLSGTIDAGDADSFAAGVRRKVIVWDNYPVNDYTYAIYHHPRLILGPLRGRAADLSSHVAGYLLNPMIQEEASKLPLYTAAAYLADPYHYDPEAAWRAAAGHLALRSGEAGGASAASVLLEFASYAQMSMLHESEAPQLSSAVAAYQAGSAATVEALRNVFEAMTTMPARLKTAVPTALYGELSPWADALRDKGLAGLAALDLDAAAARGDKDTVKAALPGVERQLTAVRAGEEKAYIAGQIVEGLMQGVISRAAAVK